MAYRRGSPEEYPPVRGRRSPAGRALPRGVYWDDNLGYGGRSPGASPPYGYRERSPRRYPGDSPQRYLEAPPSLYQDSPPRRFRNPPPQYLSPEDSPPYRYGEDAPRRYEDPRRGRPFPEDAPLPIDIDGPPPEFYDDAPRRYPVTPPRGYRKDPIRRFEASESPSPTGQYGPPPPPPGGGFVDDHPRRFAPEPNGSPPDYYDEPPRRFRGTTPPRPPPMYAEEPTHTFRGTPPRHSDGSPPQPVDEPPRRFRGASPGHGSDGSTPGRTDGGFRVAAAVATSSAAVPRQLPDGSRPAEPRRFPGPSQFVDNLPRDDAEDFPRRFPGPSQFAGNLHPDDAEDVPRRYVGGAIPSAGRPNGPPQRPPPGFPPPRAAPPEVRAVPREVLDAPPRVRAVPREVLDAPPTVRAVPPEVLDTPPRVRAVSPEVLDTPPRLSPDVYEGRSGPPSRLSPDVYQSRSDPPSRVSPDVYKGPGTPRFPPDIFAAGVGRPRPEDSPPEFADRGPYGRRARHSPPDVFEAGAVGRRPRDDSSSLDSSPPDFGRSPGVDPGFFHPPYVTPPREPYRPPPPAAGQGPLLGVPPGYATPQRAPVPGLGESPPEFLFAHLPRRHPDGYTARTPPRQPPPMRRSDAIFTADVVPIELDDKLKELQPHRGNPGSSTGGGWKDLWVALVFLLHIGGVTALCVLFGLNGLASTINNYSKSNAYRITDWFPQLTAAAIIGAVFSCVWQNAIRMAPVLMILVTIWTGSAAMTLFGIVLVATGKTTGLIGLAFLFAGICQALYAFTVSERIPFAAEILKKVVSVCSTYPSTYAVSYGVILVSLGWVAVWIFGLSGAGVLPSHLAIMAGLAVSLIWTMQVLRNIVRVTVAGTVGLFYFQERNMPRMPTYISLVKACTSSLGSICLGSLFVPLVESPCHTLRRINAQAGESEFLFSCVVCLLGCFEYLIPFFNKMGYVQVAMYGKPFVRASRDTFNMLRAQSVDVLVHDDLSITILFLACGIGGSLSALVGGTWTFVAQKGLSIYISVLSFLIGFLITYIAMAVVESGVATYYVCFAEDPASLQRHDGPFYERIWVRQMELLSPKTELTV